MPTTSETTRQRRILAAADPEHESFRARGAEVVDEEADATLHLGDGVHLRPDVQILDDFRLKFAHDARL